MGWKDQTKTDKSDHTTKRDKSKDIGEKRDSKKVPRQGQAI